MSQPLEVSFVGGDRGVWKLTCLDVVTGAGLSTVESLDMVEGRHQRHHGGIWTLRGVTSNERYVERDERRSLVDRQHPLGRPEAIHAALIPIRKSKAWWEMTQDERRAIFEARSRHIAIGLEYLPGIARRLHHCRDLGEDFDFLTWFEFAPADIGAFEDLVGRLRATEEWSYVERELDIRLRR